MGMNASRAPRYRDAALREQARGGECPILDVLHQILLAPALVVVGVLAATAAAWVALLAERGEPARLGRRELGTLSRETAARLVLGSMSLLPWGDGSPREGDGPAGPVLLVPGPPQRRIALTFLALYLRRRGHRFVWAVGPGRGTLADRAQHVAVAVERLRQASGASRVDIVAHGLGGLAAAWYLRHLGGDQRVRRLVTLGTPWRGTRMAVFTRGPLGRETLPGSPVLDGLAPPPVEACCVWGTLDPMVLPHASAVADGSVAVEIDAAGHLDLLMSARAFRAVRDALAADVLDAPRAASPDAAGAA
jgi:pimeloyl-ACP methyl ester carboxylesterase